MFKKNVLFLCTVIVLVLLSLIYGIKTSASFNNNTNVSAILKKSNNIHVSIMNNPKFSSKYFNNAINTLDDLISKSDLVVKVKVESDRTNYNQAVLSRVIIKQIFKGNEAKNGDNIFIYEPSNFIVGNVSFLCFDGYTLMQPQYEYILFLKHLEIPKGYNYSGKEQISYLPVSSIYGKYKISNNPEYKVINTSANNNLKYKEVENMDLIASNNDVLNKYKNLKLNVLDLFH